MGKYPRTKRVYPLEESGRHGYKSPCLCDRHGSVMLSSHDDPFVHLCEEIPMKHRSLAVCAAVALMASTAAQAQTEIQWWHAMSGLGEWVNDLAKAVQREPEGIQGGAHLQGYV